MFSYNSNAMLLLIHLSSLLIISSWLVGASTTQALNSLRPIEDSETQRNIIRFLKTFQASACDDEQFEIQCNEDYVIDVIYAERTIISSKTLHQGAQQAHEICRTNKELNVINNDEQICDQLKQNETQNESSDREEVTKKVRTLCRSTNKCNIDLRWNRLNQTNTSVPLNINTTTTTNNNNNNSPLNLARFELARMINGVCKGHRKLLEVSYRCRPDKMKRKHVCRNNHFNLDCGQEKRLIIVGASYGFRASETKQIDLCRADSKASSYLIPTTTYQFNSNSSINNRANPTTNEASISSTNNNNNMSDDCQSYSTYFVVMSECLAQHQCQFEVNPNILGDPKCNLNQPEYLRVIWYCANETLIQDNIFNRTYVKSLYSKMITQQPFTSTSISSSSLLVSSSSTSGLNQTSLTTQPIEIMSNSETTQQQQQQPQQEVISSTPTTTLSHSTDLEFDRDITDNYRQMASQQQQQDGSSLNNRIFTIISADPDLSTKRPINWTVKQKIYFLLAQYQPQIIIGISVLLSSIMVALLIRATRLRYSSRSSSGSSSSNECSSQKAKLHASFSSSSSNPLTGCSTNPRMPNKPSSTSSSGSSNGANLAGLKLNSCSESCFSLDDMNQYNSNNITATGQSNQTIESPALASNALSSDRNDDSPDGLTFGAGKQTAQVRPRLWSIYQPGLHHNHHQQHQQLHHQLSCATLMRQQQGSHQLGLPTKTFHCPTVTAPPIAPPTTNQQQSNLSSFNQIRSNLNMRQFGSTSSQHNTTHNYYTGHPTQPPTIVPPPPEIPLSSASPSANSATGTMTQPVDGLSNAADYLLALTQAPSMNLNMSLNRSASSHQNMQWKQLQQQAADLPVPLFLDTQTPQQYNNQMRIPSQQDICSYHQHQQQHQQHQHHNFE